nr:nuclear transport factor 2 family protein [Kitasatospora sp. MAP12-44]
MSDLNDVVARYLDIWNEADAGKRTAAIADLFAQGATYTDPLAAVEGLEGIAAVITGAREQFQGFAFNQYGTVDAHHNIVRFGWELVPAAGGENIVIGFDVAAVDDSGKIKSVSGFLDKVPAGF